MISEYSLLVNSVRLLDFKTGIKSINDLGEGAVPIMPRAMARGSRINGRALSICENVSPT